MLKQVTIFSENKRGNMRKITSVLAEKGINIWGSVTNESAEYGLIRMVVSDPDEAILALQKEEYMCRQVSVIGVEMNDEVGALNSLLGALDESNINLNYIYLSFNRDSGKPVLVFHTEDIEEVEGCIKAKGFACL